MNMIELLTKTQDELKSHLIQTLKLYGYEPIVTPDAICAKGTTPDAVTLVAHMDTINDHARGGRLAPTEQDILVTEDFILLSPLAKPGLSCLGADDRVGIWTVLEMLRRGHRPHVLFTTDEEVGCVGANGITCDITGVFDFLYDSCYLIQVDRGMHEGSWNEMVFYDCDALAVPNVYEFLSQYWEEATGSYTDVSILGPHFDKPIVNLSASYVKEHTRQEFIYVEALHKNTNNLDKLISYIHSLEGRDEWSFVQDESTLSGYSDPQYDYNKDLARYFISKMFGTVSEARFNSWYGANVGCLTSDEQKDRVIDTLELIYNDGTYTGELEYFTL